MKRVDLAFAFAQARLQARYGARPTTTDWSQVEASGDLAALLQVIRGTALGRWTARLGERPGVHAIEMRLREEWQRDVAEVAGWQPAPWRPAIEWLRWIPYLPSLQKLARGGHAPAWMRDDPVLGSIVARERPERRTALRSSPVAPLAAAFRPDGDVTRAWADHWRTLWPGIATDHAPLEALLGASTRHAKRVAQLPQDAGSRDATAAFGRRLQLHFRRHALSAAAAVAYLALLGLDFSRLRGLLAVRALRAEAAAPP